MLKIPTLNENAVLQTRQEWQSVIAQASKLNLALHCDLPKNWDSLVALAAILKRTDKTATILDAGAEIYSTILPWLSSLGYQNLFGINLVFDRPIQSGSIVYEYGDLTQTKYAENSFDAITCLSVIEHGVDLGAYFQEMSRLLKPGGILITYTDYYAEPIDTQNKVAFGVPVRIFSRSQVEEILELAASFDLNLTSPIQLECVDQVISWLELSYIFVVFTLQKSPKNLNADESR